MYATACNMPTSANELLRRINFMRTHTDNERTAERRLHEANPDARLRGTIHVEEAS